MDWNNGRLSVSKNEWDEYVFAIYVLGSWTRISVERWEVEELVAEVYASLAGDE